MTISRNITTFLLFEISGTFGGRFEKKLLRDLMVDYDNLERPVVNESHPLLVTFGITLQQIIDVVSNAYGKNQAFLNLFKLSSKYSYTYFCILIYRMKKINCS